MSLVILDDQSSSLKYTGIWTGGGTTSHYDHTASASRAAGASMAYSFTGTTIAVVGSYDANTSCTGTFALDSNVTTFSSPVLSAPLNHQTIWSSALLSDAEHTLTYTLASCTSSSAGYVWFDYILYTASASNASTDGVVYFVDDSDSRIAYSGNWTAETSNDGDFQLTSHGGKQGCSFQLEFEGTLISVYGRIGNDSANVATQSSFSVDGSTPAVFSAPYQSSISYNQPLFQSDALPNGKHTLVASSQSGTLWVDYLLLHPDSSTDNSTLTPSSAHHSSVSIGEIAGLAGGGLVLAVGIALLVIFRRRLFKGRRPRAPPPPAQSYSRPPNHAAFSAPSVTSSNYAWQSPNPNNTYPPSFASYNLQTPDTPANPFDTPPTSPRVRAGSSSADSRSALSGRGSTADSRSALSGRGSLVPTHNTDVPPSPWSTSFASMSSGHSRRLPSVGGDGDSVADLKRRQGQHHAYEDNASLLSAASRAMSGASVPRRLPPAPAPAPAVGDVQPASRARYQELDLPPVYTPH